MIQAKKDEVVRIVVKVSQPIADLLCDKSHPNEEDMAKFVRSLVKRELTRKRGGA